jgi:hypothetical protein
MPFNQYIRDLKNIKVPLATADGDCYLLNYLNYRDTRR